MRFVSLEVSNFGCIDQARLELGPGLNVLYGPNDLGKSTLAHALRAALLLLPRSTTAEEFKPWHSDAVPRVVLEFVADDGRRYRVDKSFGGGTRGQATLHWSNDGRDFALEASGRAVDGKVRELLGWGLPSAGGRGGGRGLPDSFLSTVLLGRQAQPGSVFGASLEGDADDSARQRLSAALQALAQDARFKEILEHAQAQVDLAFRADGAPRRHKDSPFRKVADRIVQLSDQLRQLEDRVHDTNNVRSRLADLDAERDEAIGVRDDADREHQRVQTDLARAQARREAAQRNEAADATLAAIAAKIEALATRRDELHAAEASRPAAATARAQAVEARDEAQRALQAAQAELQRIQEGGAAAERLQQQSLLTRQAEAKADHQRAYDEVTALEAAQRLVDKLQQTQTKLTDSERELAQTTQHQRDAEATRRTHEAKRRTFDAAVALRRFEDAAAQRDACMAAADRATAHETAAATAQREAETIEAELTARGLPGPDELDTLRALHDQLQLATARLGGGLAVVVKLEQGAEVRAATDEQPPVVHAGDRLELAAQRSVELHVPGVGAIEILAGTADARTEVERLRTQWETTGAPVLARTGVADVPALVTAMRDADRRRHEAIDARRRAEAETAAANSERTRASELPQWQTTVQERERALAGHDRAELARQVEGETEDTLRALRVEAETAIAQAQSRVDAAARDVAHHQAAAEVLRSEHDALDRDLAETRRRLGGEPAALLQAATDRLAAAEGRLETIAEELAALQESRQGITDAATQKVERAQAALDDAADRFEKADARRNAIEQKLGELRGAIEVSEQDVARLNEPAARRAAAEARAALDALPTPTEEVDATTLEASTKRLEDARADLSRIEAELRKSEGALESVGGQVVREKEVETRAALAGARQQEQEIELDYAGWQLLVATMREAENEEGRHLGDALVTPISEQFRELTRGRYGGLQLGPDLQAQGVAASGGTREVDAFSEGLQEQLATLLRLTVARQLDSALVLDDHLTQTDPERITWFRRLLRDAAADHQIVVLTCRPSDYLDPDELAPDAAATRDLDTGPLRAIDLGRVITRAGGPGSG
jgi:ParB family chromosome partitioning protein